MQDHLDISRARVRQLAKDGRLRSRQLRNGKLQYHRSFVIHYAETRNRPPVAKGKQEYLVVRQSIATEPPRPDPRLIILTQEQGQIVNMFLGGRWINRAPNGLADAVKDALCAERFDAERATATELNLEISRLRRENERLGKELAAAHSRADRLRRSRSHTKSSSKQRTMIGEPSEGSEPSIIEALCRRFPDEMPADEVLVDALMAEFASRRG